MTLAPATTERGVRCSSTGPDLVKASGWNMNRIADCPTRRTWGFRQCWQANFDIIYSNRPRIIPSSSLLTHCSLLFCPPFVYVKILPNANIMYHQTIRRRYVTGSGSVLIWDFTPGICRSRRFSENHETPQSQQLGFGLRLRIFFYQRFYQRYRQPRCLELRKFKRRQRS